MIQIDDVLDANGLKTGSGDTLISEVPKKMITLCEKWINQYCKHRKTINIKITSYGLKHAVERWSIPLTGERIYILNSAFIQAAINLGYKYENSALPGYQLTPNAMFNMSFPHKGTRLYREACLGQ